MKRKPRRVFVNENQRLPGSWLRFALMAAGTAWMLVETVLRFDARGRWARLYPVVLLGAFGWAAWHEWKRLRQGSAADDPAAPSDQP